MRTKGSVYVHVHETGREGVHQIHASCKQPRGIGTSEFSEIASFTLTISSRLPRLDIYI